MKLKRLTAILLSLVLAASLAAPVHAASSFRDIEDSAVALDAEVLRLMGVVGGVGENNFNPEANLTRAEFCKAMAAEGVPANGCYNPLYTDKMFKSRDFKRMTAPATNPYEPLPVVEEAAPLCVYLTQNMLLGTEDDLKDIVAAMDKVAAGE